MDTEYYSIFNCKENDMYETVDQNLNKVYIQCFSRSSTEKEVLQPLSSSQFDHDSCTNLIVCLSVGFTTLLWPQTSIKCHRESTENCGNECKNTAVRTNW